jgi:hypothetical protein
VWLSIILPLSGYSYRNPWFGCIFTVVFVRRWQVCICYNRWAANRSSARYYISIFASRLFSTALIVSSRRPALIIRSVATLLIPARHPS